jgi:hypothetical protein
MFDRDDNCELYNPRMVVGKPYLIVEKSLLVQQIVCYCALEQLYVEVLPCLMRHNLRRGHLFNLFKILLIRKPNYCCLVVMQKVCLGLSLFSVCIRFNYFITASWESRLQNVTPRMSSLTSITLH